MDFDSQKLFDNPLLQLCSVCGEKKKLTFEHMPPRKSGNDKPVNIVGIENMTELGGYKYQGFKKSPRGMGGFKLCEECNNLTGAWYGKAYIDHSTQVVNAINENLNEKVFEVTCKIKPLNFLKQVVCILLCADQATGHLRTHLSSPKFILEKSNKLFPENIYLSKRITIQPTFGFKGYTTSWDNKKGFKEDIEFLFKPFYFQATFDKNQILNGSMNLIENLRYDYDEEIDIRYRIQLPSKKDYKQQ